MSAVCQHQTIYLIPYYRITLKSSLEDKPVLSQSVAITEKVYKTQFVNFLNEYNKAEPDADALFGAWNTVAALGGSPYSFTDGQLDAGNTSAPVSMVDYEHHYTLNAKTPLAGSVKTDYKLNSDGTLTEVTGEVQNDTFSTILSALPISDLIKSAAGIAPKAAAVGVAAVRPKVVYAFELTIEPRFIKKTYSSYVDFDFGCPVAAKLTDGSLTVEDIGADTTKPDSKDGTDNTISVTGSIKLPKATATGGGSGTATPSPQVSPQTTGGFD